MTLQSYRDLIAWQRAVDFVEAVYGQTKTFPTQEMYGLTSQLRRAAVSIPSNVAEGQGRRSTKDFLNFLGIAYGSLCEAETQIILAVRLRFLSKESCESLLQLAAEVGRLINGLTRSLESDSCN